MNARSSVAILLAASLAALAPGIEPYRVSAQVRARGLATPVATRLPSVRIELPHAALTHNALPHSVPVGTPRPQGEEFYRRSQPPAAAVVGALSEVTSALASQPIEEAPAALGSFFDASSRGIGGPLIVAANSVAPQPTPGRDPDQLQQDARALKARLATNKNVRFVAWSKAGYLSVFVKSATPRKLSRIPRVFNDLPVVVRKASGVKGRIASSVRATDENDFPGYVHPAPTAPYRKYSNPDLWHISGELFGSVIIAGIFGLIFVPSLAVAKIFGGLAAGVIALTALVSLPQELERFRGWLAMRRLLKTLEHDDNVLGAELAQWSTTIEVYVRDGENVANIPHEFDGFQVVARRSSY